MEHKVRKVDRHTRKRYERRIRRKNRRHPIEHVIELIILAVILIIVVSVMMHSCSKNNGSEGTEQTQEGLIENTISVVEPSTSATNATKEEVSTEETYTFVEETEESEELTTEEVKPEIPTTASVWEDPFETVDSWIHNSEKTQMEEILRDWSAARYFFNLTMGSLDMVLGESSITVLTEEMNALHRNYLMSNVVIEPDNVIVGGSFVEKYSAYETLMTTMKENLKSGISVSRRYVSNDYIGFEAPLQNALGLVPASYEEMADHLKHLGITLNIIPKEIEPQEDWVDYVETLHEYGIAAGIHFPYEGMEYGTVQELKAVYQPIVDAGLDYIVLSERVFPFITGTEAATFSKRLIQMLRNEFGFDGVIVMADMSSPTIQEYVVEHQIEEPEMYAFLQGCDMVYISDNFVLKYSRLNELYEEGLISDAKLKASMERVIKIAFLYSRGE